MSTLTIIDRVNSLEDACTITGTDINSIIDIEDDYKRCEKVIETFAEALREGKPASECWYYPYFFRSSGGGFSCDACGDDRGFSAVGARLRVDTSLKASHLGKIAIDYYKKYING